MTLERNFARVMDDLKLAGTNQTLAVAFSGGSDSLTLLMLLKRHFKESKIIALTVNHNLRPESTQESTECKKIATDLAIDHVVLDWHHSGISKNVQEQARLARYKLMTEFCLKNNIRHLFVAHNKNDVAETFMTNLFRGSGIYGLSAIPMMSIANDVHIIRPLLNFDKATIQDFLSKNRTEWIEDPSNQKNVFLRTKIRNLLKSQIIADIIPEYNLLIDRIVLAANNIARAREELEKTCENFIKHEVTFRNEGYASIGYLSFSKLSEEIALKVLSCCLMIVLHKYKPQPRLKSLEKLYKDIITSKTIQTLHGCEILVKNGNIYVYREVGRQPFTAKKISDSCWIWDNRFKITALPNAIKDIVPPSSQDIERKKIQESEIFPRKIWKTLPLIITYDSKRWLPFLNGRANENFSVKFLGRTQTVGIKDDLINA